MRRIPTHLLQAATTAIIALMAATAWAHSVNNLEMRVVINDLGNARVVEVRQCSMGSSGTEGFIKQYNLHGMGVGELAVSDETGTQYAVDTPWDINRSRTESDSVSTMRRRRFSSTPSKGWLHRYFLPRM